MFLYQNNGIFVWGLSYQLGKLHRDLNQLKAAGLLANSVDELAKDGYQSNYGLAADENLLSLTLPPPTHALKQCGNPRALVFHHSYGESASIPWAETDCDLMSRGRYFPVAVLKECQLDHVPYFGSFASGCTGFLSLLLMANGLLTAAGEGAVLCVSADVKPAGVKYDALREKFLTSDCSSGFVAGHEQRGYRVLGINYYSTTRTLVPLVEIVKRTVEMIRETMEKLGLDPTGGNVVVHYPNIFPKAWKMVSQYLKIPPERHLMEGMAERAHCLSSDTMITLAKAHRGEAGRIHVAVNFGSGIHLGVCILKEEKENGASN